MVVLINRGLIKSVKIKPRFKFGGKLKPIGTLVHAVCLASDPARDFAPSGSLLGLLVDGVHGCFSQVGGGANLHFAGCRPQCSYRIALFHGINPFQIDPYHGSKSMSSPGFLALFYVRFSSGFCRPAILSMSGPR